MVKHFCDRCAIELPSGHKDDNNVYKLGNFEVEARAYQNIVRPAEAKPNAPATINNPGYKQRVFSMLCSKCVAIVLGVVQEQKTPDITELRIGPGQIIYMEEQIHISLPLSASKEDVKRILEATIQHFPPIKER